MSAEQSRELPPIRGAEPLGEGDAVAQSLAMTRASGACESAGVRLATKLGSGLVGLIFLGAVISGSQALVWIGSGGSLLASAAMAIALRLRGGGRIYLNAQAFTFGLVGAAAVPAALAWGGAASGALIAVLAVFLGLAATTSFCVGRFLYLLLRHAAGSAG